MRSVRIWLGTCSKLPLCRRPCLRGCTARCVHLWHSTILQIHTLRPWGIARPLDDMGGLQLAPEFLLAPFLNQWCAVPTVFLKYGAPFLRRSSSQLSRDPQ